MKIVIDVGVIGLAQLFETARTGIYRVISSLALELLSRDDLDLRFSSLSSLQVNRLTDQYFEEKNLAEKAFARNQFEQLLYSMAFDGDQTGGAKLANKILSRLYRMSLTGRIGRHADLFHSQYAPIPHFKGRKSPLRILTVYDIIPLIHPEYFADGFVDEFKPIIDSVSVSEDFVFTISEWTKKDICTYLNMDPARVFVTYPAASAELYYQVRDENCIAEAKEKFNIPGGRYLLTLATVEKRKNLQTSIACFRRIIEEKGNDDLHFVMVGTRGWKIREVLTEIEDDPVLRERVVFTGFVPDQYLSAIYSGAEAFIYPSLYEGFGLPPLEAMQCGLPVVVSNTSSMPEVVGDAGLLVDPLDRDGICQAMLTLLQDKNMRMQYVDRGIARARQFSWQRCADETVAGYRSIWENR